MMTDGILASQSLLTGPGAAMSGMSPQGAERFREALSRASEEAGGVAGPGAAAGDAMSVLRPLLDLNTNSMQLAEQAGAAADQKDLKPGELMMLTMRSHEFLFACELTSNVANRSSDGLQQLFRQQS
jgi:hypothetical protein